MGPNPQIKIEHQDQMTIVTFGQEGQPIRGTLPEDVASHLLNVVQLSPGQLLFDMKHVEFCNSTLIELLVRCWNRIKTRPGNILALCQLHPYCLSVLEITNLTHVWKIYPDRETAQHAMKSSDTAASPAST